MKRARQNQQRRQVVVKRSGKQTRAGKADNPNQGQSRIKTIINNTMDQLGTDRA